jgi:hypothetical protein
MRKVLFLAFTAIFVHGVFAQQTAPTRQPAPAPTRQNASTSQQSFDLTQYGVKIEPDRRLIVVLASLEAAGLETPLTGTGKSFREQLRSDLQNMPADLRQKLQTFLSQYKRRHQNETPAQINASFVSLALTLTPVPELQDPPRSADLPAELLEIFDYAPLVREFYRRSGVGANLDNYLKEYQKAGDAMRGSATVMVRDLLDYLHTKPQLSYIDRIKTETKDAKGKKKLEKTEARERERRFFIVPDLLAPAGTINFRNVGDDYYVIVPPGTNLSSSEARRAFLQFTIDPLILQNAKDIAPFRDGIKILLDERRKTNADVSPDVYLAVMRSMVAAVDARQIEFVKSQAATADARRRIDLAKGDEAKRAVSAELARFKAQLADDTALELSEAYERGAILAFYFADQLKGTEDSGFDVAGSFRDFILSMDAAKETNRLAQFADARKRATASREERRRKGSTQTVTISAELTPREKVLKEKLAQIETIIKAKDYEKAEEQLSELMKEYEGDARVFYARGRVASLSAEQAFDESLRDERLGRAAANYRNAILQSNADTDPLLKLRSHVALGRILEFNEQTEAALKEYEAAIKLGNIDAQAYNEALAAKQRLTKKP